MARDYDVIIVGAGIVGATLARALAGSTLRVALIDGRAPALDPVDDYDLRVSAITLASQQVFETLGVWAGMQTRRVSPFREMRVWDAVGEGSIHFDSAEIGASQLGHIIENPVIIAALLEDLAASGNVDTHYPNTITAIRESDRVHVTLADGEQLSALVLVGADGADSAVRRHAGIESRGWSYDQKGIVATVRTAQPHRETAWQRFLPTGPLAFLPLADGRCSIVWSNDTTRADELLALDEDAFCSALAQAFDHVLGEVRETSPRAAFPLARAHAAAYVQPRLVLIGDAAHTIHPLAGQGANLGIADAATLAEVLCEASAAQKDIGALSVLRRYERWRKGDNLATMTVMDGFKRLFGTDNAPLARLRSLGMNAADAATPLKNVLVRRAMGMTGDLPKLARGIRL